MVIRSYLAAVYIIGIFVEIGGLLDRMMEGTALPKNLPETQVAGNF